MSDDEEMTDAEWGEFEKQFYCRHGFISGCPDCDYPAYSPKQLSACAIGFVLPSDSNLATVQAAGRAHVERITGDSWSERDAHVPTEPYRKPPAKYGTPEWREARKKALVAMKEREARMRDGG